MYTCVISLSKKKWHRHTHTVEHMWRQRQKLEWCICKTKSAKDGWQQQKPGERHGPDPLDLSGGAWPWRHRDIRFLASRTVKEQIYCFKSPRLWKSVWQLQEMNTDSNWGLPPAATQTDSQVGKPSWKCSCGSRRHLIAASWETLSQNCSARLILNFCPVNTNMFIVNTLNVGVTCYTAIDR